MMDQEQLRKADVFTGVIFFLFGLFILNEAFKMPMTDSWGGVQNVWYVSPALFPLLIGSTIAFLGILLVIAAMRRLGLPAFKQTMVDLFQGSFLPTLGNNGSFRFYSITLLLVFYVYLYVPRVDFILCSMLFMITFTTGFYYDNAIILKKLMALFTGGSLLFLVYFMSGLSERLTAAIPYSTDILTIIFIIISVLYAKKLGGTELKKKFKICLIISTITPFVLGIVFKFGLLVPLMNEGAVVQIMETIRYMEF